jgi:hypothetical protein
MSRRARAIDTEEAYEASADAMFFRSQTLALVRHFFEISCQIGRLPSIMGREFFRARVSHHAIPSFEDQVLFVHDVESALAKLEERDAEVITLVGLFHYSLTEAAALLGRSRSTVCERYADSIDRLAQLFLEAGLLKTSRPDRRLKYFSAGHGRAAAMAPPKKPPLSVRAPGTALAAQH